MDIPVLGAAIVSISGALFATASVWSVIGLLLRDPDRSMISAASRGHLLTSALIVIAGLVTHIVGFFPEAFALLYAGGASMVVAAVGVRASRRRIPRRVGVPGILAAAGLVVLSVGLLLGLGA